MFMDYLATKHELEKAIEDQGLKDLLPIADKFHKIWVEGMENTEYEEVEEKPKPKKLGSIKKRGRPRKKKRGRPPIYYPCPECGRKCGGRNSLAGHLKRYHSIAGKRKKEMVKKAVEDSQRERRRMMLED